MSIERHLRAHLKSFLVSARSGSGSGRRSRRLCRVQPDDFRDLGDFGHRADAHVAACQALGLRWDQTMRGAWRAKTAGASSKAPAAR